jgi:hypothetical protein
MPRLTPTLHKDVPLQTRVRVDAQYLGKEVTGTVAGIASLHVVFQYIIILDAPHQHDGETYTAITALGSHLMNEEGVYAWRLTSQEAHDLALSELRDRASGQVA